MIARFQDTLLKPDTVFKKPFIVAGLGLTVGVSLWYTVVPSFSDLMGMATWGAIAVGAGTWWLSKQNRQPLDFSLEIPQTLNRQAVEETLERVKEKIAKFNTTVAETAADPDAYDNAIAHLQQQQAQLVATLDRTQLQCIVTGMKGVGKTMLMNQVIESGVGKAEVGKISVGKAEVGQQNDAAPYSLMVGELDATLTMLSAQQTAVQQTKSDAGTVPDGAHDLDEFLLADMVVFVTDGDLTASEFNTVQALLQQGHTLILAFNQQDRYLPTERLDIFERIQARLQDSLGANNIVTTSAIATTLKVRQHQPDGSITERTDEHPANVVPLTSRIQSLLAEAPEELVWKTTLRQAHHLQNQIQSQWNQLKRDRALPIIEKYQWMAAAAAFANPIPSFDLVATGAINAQLLVDLGEIYQQPFALDQAKMATGTLAELMVKLGLVELATQAIAPLLKTHALTFAAGGAAQGLSAAYLTHVAGLSLIQYFEERSYATEPATTETAWNLDRLGQIMQQVFQTYQRGHFLQALVDKGLKQLSSQLGAKPQSPNLTIA